MNGFGTYRMMFKNKPYVYLVLNLSTVYFMTANIQFWMSDYLILVDKFDYQTTVIIFTSICISAPVLGALTGGYIGNKIGGYESVYALPLCIGVGMLVMLASFPVC